MANPSTWTNEERNHHNAYSGNSTTPPEISSMKHNTGFYVNWTSDEQNILVENLARYKLEPSVKLYTKIASALPNKSIRDVAARCRWMICKKENSKRRKEDHNGVGRATLDFEHFIQMAMDSKNSQLAQDETTNKLLKENEQWFDQISANLTSNPLRLKENLELFYKTQTNIKTLLSVLNGNVSEQMKHMPPLPDLNDELFAAIYPPSNLP